MNWELADKSMGTFTLMASDGNRVVQQCHAVPGGSTGLSRCPTRSIRVLTQPLVPPRGQAAVLSP